MRTGEIANGRRQWILGLGAVGLGGVTLSLTVGGQATGQRLRDRVTSILPNVGFSVDGRRGVFLKQVSTRPYPQGARTGEGNALGGASSILDRGDAQAYRLRVPLVEKQISDFVAKLDEYLPNRDKQKLQIIVTGLTEYSPKALPDGSVVIHLGTFERAESDDELAFILAHEISHVRLGHYITSGSFARSRQMASSLAGAYAATTSLTEQRLVSQGDKVEVVTKDQARVDRSARRAAANTGYVHTLLNVLAEPLWSRAQEDEADALAYDITLACNYSADAAADTVFSKVPLEFEARKRAAEAAQSQVSELTATLLDENSGLFTGEGAALKSKMTSELKSGLRDKVFSLATGFFQQKHRAPKARKDGIAKYSGTAYPNGVAQRDVVSPWLTGLKKNAQYVQAKKAATAVDAAQAALREGQFDLALKAIAPALTTPFAGSPFVGNAAAEIYDAAHNTARADQLYTAAHLSPDQTVDGYTGHVDMLLRAKRYDRARTIIAQAEKRFGDEQAFIAKKIAIDMRTGKKDAAIANLQKCSAYEIPQLKQDCVKAVLDDRYPEAYEKLNPAQKAKVDRELSKIGDAASIMPNMKGMFDGLGGMFGKQD